ncbi:hypothetical protein RRV45_15210 [Bacillus sp. DTU_2020_1000418_1_SI_GHA_SEK_038]|uniref:hypothetical protein n=1 Tax=Bacillus sp. DTU_2020_1000418_1_SI_GHA_SEK_038 TaxID=3077585 RepID=UPI0028EC4CFF|nr:hypothetical protein [Bacillus sp. DTU_2020_1000418_1_SI_GHA_SEK_038]WNS74258.1 hypothetical protein RRV45_15210 [Bacillus sp. DTU_2020_1000418_1_SI_GHA_SEK_038]
MSAKISKYRTGEPRFGTRGSKDIWDSSVKTSFLSPEELAKYRNGDKGGTKVYTQADYEKMRAKGISNAQIADEMKTSVATLYNRLKAWKRNELTKPKQPAADVPEVSETKPSKTDQEAEYRTLISELSTACEDAKLEVSSLRTERDNYRDQLLETRDELVRKDYELENVKRDFENVDITIKRFAQENKALRELVALWI